MDFVIGVEIKLSNNHTVNGGVFVDVCDELIGKYPKGFLFYCWHAQCRCYQIPILKSMEMFIDELKEAVKEDYSHLSNFQKEVKKMPANFKNHLAEKMNTYKGYKTMSYW